MYFYDTFENENICLTEIWLAFCLKFAQNLRGQSIFAIYFNEIKSTLGKKSEQSHGIIMEMKQNF